MSGAEPNEKKKFDKVKESTKWKGNLWYESKYLQTIYKALISKICQQHMQLNSKNKQTNLIRICAEQTFPKMISIDNMYMKRWLISLIIIISHLIKRLFPKRWGITSDGECGGGNGALELLWWNYKLVQSL